MHSQTNSRGKHKRAVRRNKLRFQHNVLSGFMELDNATNRSQPGRNSIKRHAGAHSPIALSSPSAGCADANWRRKRTVTETASVLTYLQIVQLADGLAVFISDLDDSELRTSAAQSSLFPIEESKLKHQSRRRRIIHSPVEPNAPSDCCPRQGTLIAVHGSDESVGLACRLRDWRGIRSADVDVLEPEWNHDGL